MVLDSMNLNIMDSFMPCTRHDLEDYARTEWSETQREWVVFNCTQVGS
jgi:hypothetical protein